MLRKEHTVHKSLREDLTSENLKSRYKHCHWYSNYSWIWSESWTRRDGMRTRPIGTQTKLIVGLIKCCAKTKIAMEKMNLLKRRNYCADLTHDTVAETFENSIVTIHLQNTSNLRCKIHWGPANLRMRGINCTVTQSRMRGINCTQT